MNCDILIYPPYEWDKQGRGNNGHPTKGEVMLFLEGTIN